MFSFFELIVRGRGVARMRVIQVSALHRGSLSLKERLRGRLIRTPALSDLFLNKRRLNSRPEMKVAEIKTNTRFHDKTVFVSFASDSENRNCQYF